MSRLEIKVDGEDVSAEKMLECARRTLKLLRAIERSVAKREERKPSVLWRVDMMSGFSYGLISLRAEPASDEEADKRLRNIVWDAVQQRMAAVQQANEAAKL